jgi:hypothetical protein
VKWKHFGADEATWELEDSMRMTYNFCFLYKLYIQCFRHREQCLFKGEGDVTPCFPHNNYAKTS